MVLHLVFASCIAIGVATAGCSGADDTGTGGGGTSSRAASPTGPMATVPAPPASLLQRSWAFVGCALASVTMEQDPESAQEGLPPDHQLRYDGLPDLVIDVVQCQALVRGNTTVLQPFTWAITYHELAPFEEGTDERFAREIVVADAQVAADLAAFGFPSVVGTVYLGGDSQRVATVETASWSYRGEWPELPGDGTSPGQETHVYRGGDDHRQFAMRLAVMRGPESTLAMPVAMQADGGYIGGVTVAGSYLGTCVETVGWSAVTTFEERLL